MTISKLEFVEELSIIHSHIRLITFSGYSVSAKFKCSKCGTVFTDKPSTLLSKKLVDCCPTQSKAKLSRKLKTLHPTIRVKSFASLYKAAEFSCSCGYDFSMTPRTLLNKDTGNACRKCSGLSELMSTLQTKPQQQYVEELRTKTNNTIKLIGEYVSANTPTLHRCTEHGHDWIVRPASIVNLVFTGCAICKHTKVTQVPFIDVSISGRDFKVQGYEPYALDYMINSVGIRAKDISVSSEGSVPVISYFCLGARRKYFPDAYVKSRNLIVEVKSHYTLCGREDWFEKNVAKYKAVTKAGYKFKLLVMAKAGAKFVRLPVPNNWHKYSRIELFSALTASLQTLI